jgi:carbon starvation protein
MSYHLLTFMNSFGIPLEIGKVFVILAFSAFALTSLDTATRIGRYIFQEFFSNTPKKTKKIFTNIYTSTFITVLASAALLAYGYKKIWPIFGSANQLLAALALLAVSSWLANTGKKTLMTVIPMIFMFAVSLSALFLLIKQYLFSENKNLVLGSFAVLLFVLAIVLIGEAYKSLNVKRKVKA